MQNTKTWLDVLTDGQLARDWLSLFGHLFLAMAYWMLIISGFAFAFATLPILIGIPMLLFMLATARAFARLDRQMVGALLQDETPEMTDDVDTAGANLGERLGMYLGSWTTWRSLLYLAIKLPLGMGTFMASMIALPILAVEMLAIAPLTAPTRPISPMLLHWIALASHRIPGLLLPTRKRKRDISRLETHEEAAEPRYYIDEEGEISSYKRGY